MAQISATRTIFRDDFNGNGPLDSSNWNFPTGAPSFLGATQIRPSLPTQSNGNAVLQLDTFNPSGNPSDPTYFGSAAFTNQFFGFTTSNSPGGIAFETRARLSPTDGNGAPANPSGLIAGFFPFVALGPNSHDEIDYEWIPKRSPDPAHPTLTQTNAYHDDPYGDGIYKTAPIPGGGSLMDFHTFRIEWLPTQVRWFVDGQMIRSEGTTVPSHDMQLWMNIWAPPAAWTEVADWTNLPAVSSAGQNQTRLFELDYVSVEALSAQIGTRSANLLSGTALNDHFRSLGGADEVRADAGDDEIRGGSGADTVHGEAGNDTIRGSRDDDQLFGGSGDDFLAGGFGGDLLSGDEGADRVSGGDGDDVLIGGRDADRLIGGAGADSFRFEDVLDSRRGAIDTIFDFNRAEGDRIDVSAIDTDPVAGGDQGFAFIAAAAFTGSGALRAAAELRYEARGNGVLVEADADGDGRADLVILVLGTTSLDETDFLL